MAEDKKPQAKPKTPVVPKVEPKLVLDWLAIGKEVEDILGLDGTATVRDVVKVYPLVKKLIVGPIIQYMKGDK